MNGHLISVHLWHRLSTFFLQYFLQNLKNPLVVKRTIKGWTLGRPVGSWVSFGDRITAALQFPKSNFSLGLIIKSKLQKHITCAYGKKSWFSAVSYSKWPPGGDIWFFCFWTPTVPDTHKFPLDARIRIASHARIRIASYRMRGNARMCEHSHRMREMRTYARIHIACAKMRAFESHRAYARIRIACAEMRALRRERRVMRLREWRQPECSGAKPLKLGL